MPKITSIMIEHQSWALLPGNDIGSHTTFISRRGKIRHSLFRGSAAAQVDEYKIDRTASEAFFDFLESDISIDGWEDDYSVPVCDGWHWVLTIRHSDNCVKKVEGTVEPPPRGKEIDRAIRKLVRYKRRPWLF